MNTAVSPLKILAVDDELLLLYALERAFKDRPLDIKTAVTCQQALAEIDTCHFDLFMLDLDRRDQSRLDLIRTIDERCPYVPMIVMTTSDRKAPGLNETIRVLRRQGAWHLLEKPFSLDTLIRFVETIFEDEANIKLGLGPLTCNSEHEKRQNFRRPHVQPVSFSYKTIVDGVLKQNVGKGILTDISDCGSGILAHEQLQPGQVLSFEDDFPKKQGIIAWSVMLEQCTCRCGLQFC